MKIYSIDEMPNLKKQLGTAGCDRIRGHMLYPHRRQFRARNIQNTVIEGMQFRKPSDPGCRIADVLTGLARSCSHGEKPLNTLRVYSMLQTLELINNNNVMRMMQVSKQTAGDYVKVAQLAIPFIEQILNSGDNVEPVQLHS